MKVGFHPVTMLFRFYLALLNSFCNSYLLISHDLFLRGSITLCIALGNKIAANKTGLTGKWKEK